MWMMPKLRPSTALALKSQKMTDLLKLRCKHLGESGLWQDNVVVANIVRESAVIRTNSPTNRKRSWEGVGDRG